MCSGLFIMCELLQLQYVHRVRAQYTRISPLTPPGTIYMTTQLSLTSETLQLVLCFSKICNGGSNCCGLTQHQPSQYSITIISKCVSKPGKWMCGPLIDLNGHFSHLTPRIHIPPLIHNCTCSTYYGKLLASTHNTYPKRYKVPFHLDTVIIYDYSEIKTLQIRFISIFIHKSLLFIVYTVLIYYIYDPHNLKLKVLSLVLRFPCLLLSVKFALSTLTTSCGSLKISIGLFVLLIRMNTLSSTLKSLARA
uniref:Phlebovirus_G2 domain-containing protein n=1 Tax=Heterorhabditis bacteriophora TaxID=37862 RepID=A0A1I7WQP3_HETBA